MQADNSPGYSSTQVPSEVVLSFVDLRFKALDL